MWVFLNMRPSRKQCLSVLMLMFHQLKRVPREHLQVCDMYAVVQLLFPRMLELLNEIDEGDDSEWFPSFTKNDKLYRAWRRERGTSPQLKTLDDFLDLLKYEPVLKWGRKFTGWVQNLKIDSDLFDILKFDGGPISRFLRPVVTYMYILCQKLCKYCVNIVYIMCI